MTLTSLAVQLVFIQDVPPVDPSTTDRYLAAFVGFWDMHRQPVDFAGATVRLNAAALVVGLVWMTRHRSALPRPVQLLLRFVVCTAALSLTLAALSWIPPDRLPASFLIAMPGRLLNLNVLLLVAMIVGFGGHLRQTWPGAVLLVLLTATLLIGNRSGLWMFEGDHQAAFRDLPPSLAAQRHERRADCRPAPAGGRLVRGPHGAHRSSGLPTPRRSRSSAPPPF